MRSHRTRLQGLAAGLLMAASLLVPGMAEAQQPSASLPMDSVYRGPIRYPDFAGRDRNYANFRTRIRNEMSTGPNFAGHYAIVTIGCGTGCKGVLVADVATGEVFSFPYGGEENYMMDLEYNVKSNGIVAKWISGDTCVGDSLSWNGRTFESYVKKVLGPREACDW